MFRNRHVKQALRVLPFAGALLVLLFGTGGCRSLAAIYSSLGSNDVSPEQSAGLKKALEQRFQHRLDQSTVLEFELLRGTGTTTGISFPKYYVWIKLNSQGQDVEQGIVRLAEVDTAQYEVTDYFSSADIKRAQHKVYETFPRDIADIAVLRSAF
jgi:hypothetical protein